MDSAQAAQMIAWLDEEQRRNKTHIAELYDLVQKQSSELADQRKRYEDLLNRFSHAQNDLGHMTEIDQAVQQIKSELASILHDVREEIRRSEQQGLQARQFERDSDAKNLSDLLDRVEHFTNIDDKLVAVMNELQRQNELLTGLRQRVDGVEKEVIRNVDQAHLDVEDHKREMGRMDAIQQMVDSIRTQIESYAARFQYLERWAQTSGQRTAETQTFKADMQRLQSELQEAQRRSEQRVERQVREWTAATETIHRDQETWANQLRIFSEQHERTKKALAGIQDLAKELRMGLGESRQGMELNSEKQRRELRDWQGENEKRWTRYLSQWEFRWNEQRKADENLLARIEELELNKSPLDKELQILRSQVAEAVSALRADSLEQWRFQLEAAQRQVDIAKATADKLHVRLEQQEAVQKATESPEPSSRRHIGQTGFNRRPLGRPEVRRPMGQLGPGRRPTGQPEAEPKPASSQEPTVQPEPGQEPMGQPDEPKAPQQD